MNETFHTIPQKMRVLCVCVSKYLDHLGDGLYRVIDHQSLIGIHAHSFTQPMIARTPRILYLSLLSIAHIRERYWSAQIDDISVP